MADKQTDWITVGGVGEGEIHDFNENKSLEGTYLGAESNVGSNSSMLYAVKTKDGSIKKFWGSSLLDTKMQQIERGVMLRVTFVGLKDSQKRKGAKYKDFIIQYYRQDAKQQPAREPEVVNTEDIPF